MYSYEYPRPAVTVDLVLFSQIEKQWHLLLIQRKHPPFEGRWAFPGGFVEIEESLEEAAARELQEETGVEEVSLEQLHTFGDPHRDPRGRTITVVYFGILNAEQHPLRASSDAKDARWFPLNHLPPLAFDHDQIADVARKRLVEIMGGKS